MEQIGQVCNKIIEEKKVILMSKCLKISAKISKISIIKSNCRQVT